MNCSANIVYSNSWLSQSASITSFTMVTASAAGLYRVSVAGGSISGSPSVIADVKYNGSSALIDVDISSSVGNAGLDVIIQLSSSDTLTFDTRYTGTGSYDVFVAVEQLV